MTEQQHILSCLIEECAEVQKEVTKILRFGLDDGYKGKLNSKTLNEELNDLMGVIDMLPDFGVKVDITDKAMEAKQQKVKKFIEYAYKVGTITKNK